MQYICLAISGDEVQATGDTDAFLVEVDAEHLVASVFGAASRLFVHREEVGLWQALLFEDGFPYMEDGVNRETRGAAGGIEAAFSVLSIKEGTVPPTINLEDPDPECDLNYTPNAAVKQSVDVAMSNVFGFGGHNASLLFKKYQQQPTQ